MNKIKLELFFKLVGLGATSGLVIDGDSLFLISDNGSFLYEYHFQSSKLESIRLFENSQANLLKSEKLDFESIVKHNYSLFLFGSGSTEKRMTAVEYNLKNKNINTIDLTPLFTQIKISTGIDSKNINIEGVVKYNKKWLFFQRGNGTAAQNGVIQFENTFINPTKMNFIPIVLPQFNNVNATFTDAILVKDKIYFLATAENSNSTYEDGNVLGSWIGILNADTLQLEFYAQISNQNKMEGITLYKNSKAEIEFLLCEDNDTDILEAAIYQLTIKKTTR